MQRYRQVTVKDYFSLLASHLKWFNVQRDVKAAYLYAPLKKQMYMKQPQSFIIKGSEHLICKLDEVLYGQHQTGRMQYFDVDRILLNFGFEKFNYANCAYMLQNFAV